jgi:pimeloyl-ACP methyl ester carboxylesterase
LIDALPGQTGLTFEPRVMLFGFSRGSQEAIRFSLMFPEATLGVAGLSAGSYTLPITTYKATATDPARLLPYPYGTGDVATICGRAFDPDAARRVAYWIGVGGSDNRVEDVPRQWDQYVGNNRVERAKRYVEVLQQFGAQATFELFANADHEVTDTMRADAVHFLASLSS